MNLCVMDPLNQCEYVDLMEYIEAWRSKEGGEAGPWCDGFDSNDRLSHAA